MITLGIETSCDETAVCLLETQGDSYRVLGSAIHSQIDIHKEYGGVFPMLAKREHGKKLVPLLEKILTESNIPYENISIGNTQEIQDILSKEQDLCPLFLSSSLMTRKPCIDRIVVTHGPGLEPALWVGISFARALHKIWNIPIFGVNHMEGHVVSSFVHHSQSQGELIPFTIPPLPAVALLVSGGHTEIVYTKDLVTYELVGKTKDDAIGEAFDKVARMMNIPYPGGPVISAYAEYARTHAIESPITLPRPMIHTNDMNFSFSGLKTAVLYGLREHESMTDDEKKGLCREFEDAVTEVIITKTRKALDTHNPASLLVGGGVIANTHIRTALETLAREYGIPLHIPHMSLTGDNALMIAIAGSRKPDTMEQEEMRAQGNLSLSEK